jgi:hypothetical protein
VAAFCQKLSQPFRGLRDRIGRGDANGVEALAPAIGDERSLGGRGI